MEAPLRPLERIGEASGGTQPLSNAHEGVGGGLVLGQHLHHLVNVAARLGQSLHHIGDAVALPVEGTAGAGSQPRETVPGGLREAAVGGDALFPQHLGVGGGRAGEHLEVAAVQLPVEQAAGKHDGVRMGLGAGLEVEGLELGRDLAKVAIGVVDRPDRLLGLLERVFGEGDDRHGVTITEQVPERGDHRVDALCVGVGLAIGDEPLGGERLVDGLGECPQREGTRDGPRRLQAQSRRGELIRIGQLQHQVHEPFAGEPVEVGAEVDRGLVVWLPPARRVGGDQGERHGVLAKAPLGADRAGAREAWLAILTPELHPVGGGASHHRPSARPLFGELGDPAASGVVLPSVEALGASQRAHHRAGEHFPETGFRGRYRCHADMLRVSSSGWHWLRRRVRRGVSGCGGRPRGPGAAGSARGGRVG